MSKELDQAIVELSRPGPGRVPAWKMLKEAGQEGRVAVREGLSHPQWRVRKWCALFIDNNADVESLERLLLTLHDPHHKVRMWAVHALGCDRCKGGEMVLDAVPQIAERLRDDKSLKVRRTAANFLALRPTDKRARRALRRALEVETDHRLVNMAKWGLGLHEYQLRGSA